MTGRFVHAGQAYLSLECMFSLCFFMRPFSMEGFRSRLSAPISHVLWLAGGAFYFFPMFFPHGGCTIWTCLPQLAGGFVFYSCGQAVPAPRMFCGARHDPALVPLNNFNMIHNDNPKK